MHLVLSFGRLNHSTWHGGKDGVRSTECGVRSAEYGVRSTECGVRSAEYGVRSLSLKCFFRFGGDF